MRFPVNRQALAKRNQLDECDELLQAVHETPLDRLSIALQLSELSRKVSTGVASFDQFVGPSDLQDKAALYAKPLRQLVK